MCVYVRTSPLSPQLPSASIIIPDYPALLGELQVTPDVPIALVQLSTTRNDLLVISCNQLYAVNKWIFNPGQRQLSGFTVTYPLPNKM